MQRPGGEGPACPRGQCGWRAYRGEGWELKLESSAGRARGLSLNQGGGLPRGSKGGPPAGRRASAQHSLPCVALSKSPTLSELLSSPVWCSEGEMLAQRPPCCGHCHHFCSHGPPLWVGSLRGADGTTRGNREPRGHGVHGTCA